MGGDDERSHLVSPVAAAFPPRPSRSRTTHFFELTVPPAPPDQRVSEPLAPTNRKGNVMNSFGSQSELKSGGKTYEIFRLSALEKRGINLHRLPFSLRILLE